MLASYAAGSKVAMYSTYPVVVKSTLILITLAKGMHKIQLLAI